MFYLLLSNKVSISQQKLESFCFPVLKTYRRDWTEFMLNQKSSDLIFHPFFFLLILFFLIGGWLLYNVVLLSAMHQHESATGIRMSSPP